MDRSPSSRPLPTYAAEVLETLEPEIESTPNGLPRADAETYLAEAGFEASTVEVALEQLLNRGFLYAVNDRLRLTDRDT